MRKQKIVALAIVALLVQASIIALVCASEDPILIPRDPGPTPETSVRVYSNMTYLQSLNSSDTSDVYNFTAYNQHWINITFTPPPNSNCSMNLRAPDFSPKQGTDRSSAPQEIHFKATTDGDWYLEMIFWGGSGGNYTFRIEPLNFPPITPNAPTGPVNGTGYVYNDTIFSAVTTDVENDSINYVFDWDDGTNTTIDSRPSGQATFATHQWTRPSDNTKPAYNVTARAQDEHGNWSAWSTTTSIIIKQNDGGDKRDANYSKPVFFERYRFDDEVLTSAGTLYNDTNPTDVNDWYTFPLEINDIISATMTPPPNVDFDLELWDPPHENSTTSKNPAGQMESITRTADIAGNWTLRIYIPNVTISGSGQYTFTLTVKNYSLILKASKYPPEGLTFKIDGIPHNATSSQPVNVTLSAGLHTIQAQQGFVIWLGDYGYMYTFSRWSDGVTANPRTITLIQDTTLTAIYRRLPGIIL